MTSRNYERLSIEKFGRHLITSGDLDPVYIALHKVQWDEAQLHRWLIAYWCFYHCGAASFLSQFSGSDYWLRMMIAAKNVDPAPDGGRWPRGSERRHARGEQGVKMVADLRDCSPVPEEMVLSLTELAHEWTGKNGLEMVPFEVVSDHVKKFTLFGPWIAFKIADMLDRVLEVPVDFDQAAVFMFKDPMKAVEMLYREVTKVPDAAKLDMSKIVDGVVGYLEKEFADLTAPPLHDRVIGLQEVETVLCKWKSHMNGHYPLLNDTDEIRAGLTPAWGAVGQEFLAAMPEGSHA